MPQGGEGELSPWHDFTLDNSAWNNTVNQAGHRFGSPPVIGTGTVWYPTVGYHHYSSGMIGAVQSEGCAWTTTTTDIHSYYLSFFQTKILPSMHYFRATSYPVRCIRE